MSNKLCRLCCHSGTDPYQPWQLFCYNTEVTNKDSWVLAAVNPVGTSCRDERAKSWILFPICGKAGKQWSPKK